MFICDKCPGKFWQRKEATHFIQAGNLEDLNLIPSLKIDVCEDHLDEIMASSPNEVGPLGVPSND